MSTSENECFNSIKFGGGFILTYFNIVKNNYFDA